jgi:propionyl-CoA carboxylase alpha chain
VTTGSEVSVYYDPMLAKLIVFGSDRDARSRGSRSRSKISRSTACAPTFPLLLWIARDEAFRAGETTTSFLAQRLDESIFTPRPYRAKQRCYECRRPARRRRAPWRIGERRHAGLLAARPRVRNRGRRTRDRGLAPLGRRRPANYARIAPATCMHARVRRRVDLGAVRTPPFDVHIDRRPHVAFAAPPSGECRGPPAGRRRRASTAPMPGKIVKIAVGREGDAVEEHALLVVLEAMKMEHRIEASAGATVPPERSKRTPHCAGERRPHRPRRQAHR